VATLTASRAGGKGGYVCHRTEQVLVIRPALIVAVVAVLAVASDAPAGGIADETCPNVAGENTNTCPSGTVGVPYSIRFSEREGSGCGPGRQTFHHDSGELPPGLTLAPNGDLGGTAIQPGTFKFYVEMREPVDDPYHCAGKRTQKQFTLTIRRKPWVIATPTVPPRSEIGVPFRMRLRARGGSGIFSWTLTGGQLPAGLRIGVDGSIAGTPRTPGTSRFAATAWDTEARSLTWRTKISVAPRLRIRTQRLPAGHLDRRYRAELAASGGVAPTTWTVVRGRLPRGIRLSATHGRFAGAPKEAGTHVVYLEVRDRLKAKDVKRFRIVVRRSG
jgi:hypothetical protein